MNSFGIWGGFNSFGIWGGVFYVGSKMNSFGFGGRGILRWMKNELIWNLGGVFYVGSKMNSFGILEGGSFTLDQK